MYSLLRSSPTDQSFTNFHDEQLEKSTTSSQFKYSRLCLLLCLICTAINVFLALGFQSPTALPLFHTPVTRKKLHLLRRPSQYIHFDEIQRPSPPVPRQFNIYPILLTQLDKSDKTKVFDDDPRRHMTGIGTVSPEDRRVLITKNISTIFQFRAIDYGMETCELSISLPTPSKPSFSAISVLRLNATVPLDVQTLSYHSRPHTVSKVADILVDSDRTWHRKFFCAMDEVLTFELTCASENCEVEWWQDPDEAMPEAVIYMTQYSTI